MRKLPLALHLIGASALLVSGFAQAQATAPASPHTFTGKAAFYSEYEYRGLAQTSEKPAVQGTLDYAHASGFYVGTFVSNIKWLKDTGTALGTSIGGKLEWDIYGGYKWGFAEDWTLDVGYLRYQYPSSNAVAGAFAKPNTDEVYVGVSRGPATLKYSYGFSEIFGVLNSKGSDYLELAVNYPIVENVTLNGVLGHQRYKGTVGSFKNSSYDYGVAKLGATFDFGDGLNAGAYMKFTNADPALFTYLGKEWSRNRFVAFVSYSF